MAVDGTFFRRWGRNVFAARWAYDGSAQGGKKIAFGNTWVVAAIVVRLPFCSSPVALPVLFRLWRGKGTASQVELAAQMVKVLAAAFPGRPVHGTGDAAFHGESLAVEGTTWTTRLPANAVLHGPKPPPTGKRGPPAAEGRPAGHLRRGRAARGLARHRHPRLRQGRDVQVACCQALWYGSFRSAPGQLLLIREPGSAKPYDLGLFTLDTQASPAALAERYSWRWAIEPSNATGKQLTRRRGRLQPGPESRRAHRPVRVPRPVPDDHLVRPRPATPPHIGRRRSRCPWYRTKATPAPADMHAALRGEFTDARISGISPGHNDRDKSPTAR